MTIEPRVEGAGPFLLNRVTSGRAAGLLFDMARPVIERTLALPTLNRLYAEATRPDGPAGSDLPDPAAFPERALAVLGVAWEAPDEDLARIPRTGPLVVVANHPFGGIDGLVLLSLLGRIRPDVRLIGNLLLQRIRELRGCLFPVDPFGGPRAAARSAAGLRAALRWIRGGGALGIFPAGEVAHLRLDTGRVTEPDWSGLSGRLAQRAGAPVVPVFIAGRNSRLFQAAGLIHHWFRTILLPREMLHLRGTTVQVRIGGPIGVRKLDSFEDPADLAAYLRGRTGLLGVRCRPSGHRTPAREKPESMPRTGSDPLPAGREEIAPAVCPGVLEREVAAIPGEQVLAACGTLSVIYTRGGEHPGILREIGRLREIAFRAAGEGTGRGLDLDPFDDHYLHLLVWDGERREILGAYRLGPTDEILPRRGPGGLYTSTLFRFRRQLLQQIDPALELGRSFVRPERQKEHAPLALLWKGIGAYVAAHPRYRMLFGPVSISNEYRSLSRDILMSFLRTNRYEEALARLVRPRRPAEGLRGTGGERRALGALVRSLDDVEELLREIETDRKGIPVLLRQYLRLNAVLLGFNVDPEFSDVLDGLVLVDLTRVDRAILARFMGGRGAERFLAFHADRGPISAGLPHR